VGGYSASVLTAVDTLSACSCTAPHCAASTGAPPTHPRASTRRCPRPSATSPTARTHGVPSSPSVTPASSVRSSLRVEALPQRHDARIRVLQGASPGLGRLRMASPIQRHPPRPSPRQAWPAARDVAVKHRERRRQAPVPQDRRDTRSYSRRAVRVVRSSAGGAPGGKPAPCRGPEVSGF